MKKYKFAFFLSIFFLTAGLFFVGSENVLAETSTVRTDMFDQLGSAAGPDGAGFSQYYDPRETVAKIIRQALGLLGIIFLSLTVYAGYLWMTAAGDGEQVTKATGILRTAIIGLIIILVAYSISSFVMQSLLEGIVQGSGQNLNISDICAQNPADPSCAL